MEARCPICGEEDRIQKVTAVVADGTRSGSFSGRVEWVDDSGERHSDVTTLSGTEMTRLARELGPPPEPGMPWGFGCWWIPIIALLVPVIFYLAVVGAGFAVGTVELEGADAVLSCGLGLGFWLLIAVVIFWAVRFVSRWIEAQRERARDRYEARHAAWEAAMERYDRLYYCFRDDAVFDPSTGGTSRRERLADLLRVEA